ncbi:cobalt-precorrin-5B (C(1))-methyltransferase [Methanocella sp. CWC-04]|uniref:Cobalt-precorrin-5B C(1)-methyltransferase n=1 Tax=Methanooceanicella nereidis TaxID=2052831 RepID=A0AAP2RFR3_9EURY|nr:cobalt-precorrin-5B (C(1))-methyltransferase [Methanocella sp. CWC-04]MCD1295397.1 cobalt-precorrin-5B (C(1))-methyltransferase [Methanocella sp. CWC-04]
MVRDPVTDFEYPDVWVCACKCPELMDDVKTGLCVLTSSGDVLRRGYSTGATAAAACKAAVMSLKSENASVDVDLPGGRRISVKVNANKGCASAYKYSGDYKGDVTSGAEFRAVARFSKRGITLNAGKGIGRFSRDTPRYARGTPAISTAAMEYIMKAIEDAVNEIGANGVEVYLFIPSGEEIATKTLNYKLGILGGISVAGTTGLVEPWDDHAEESIAERLKGHDKVVITTGRTGLRASRRIFPEHEAVLVGTRIKHALECAEGEIILCGLPALILKFINPRILDENGFNTVEEMSTSPEWHFIIDENLRSFKMRIPSVRTVLIDRDCKVIGDSG